MEKIFRLSDLLKNFDPLFFCFKNSVFKKISKFFCIEQKGLPEFPMTSAKFPPNRNVLWAISNTELQIKNHKLSVGKREREKESEALIKKFDHISEI